MKTLRILLACTIAFIAVSCSKDEETVDNDESQPVQEEYDDYYYAEHASVGSSDSAFTPAEDGGIVSLGAEGGEIVVAVDCDTEWVAESSSSEVDVECDFEAGTVTIYVAQNTSEEEFTAVVNLMTANLRVVFATISINQEGYTSPTITVEASEWHAPAVGALTTEIAVYSTDEWEIGNSCEWLTVEKTDAGICITAAENGEFEERGAEFTVTCTDGISSDSQTVQVTQDARAYVTVSEESLRFDGEESFTIAIESNYGWTYSDDGGWLVFNGGGYALTATSTVPDSADARECTITISAGDGLENVAEARISVVQTGYGAMVLVYRTTVADETIKTAFDNYDTFTGTIEWGDGSTESFTSTAFPSHTYSEAGEYIVRVTGSATGFLTSSLGSGEGDSLIGIKQWGDFDFKSFSLGNSSNLEFIATDRRGAFSNITSFYGGFQNCSSLKEIPAGLFDYCANSSDFSWLFSGCISLTTVPEGLFDNCVKATTFARLFDNCSSLTSVPASLFLNCGNVTNFGYIFSGTSLTTVPSKVFEGCEKATNYRYAFYNCASLTSVPAGLFDDSRQVTTFEGTFSGCTSLIGESPYTDVDGTRVHLYERGTVNVGGFVKPTNTTGCFKDCTGLDDYDDVPAGWK